MEFKLILLLLLSINNYVIVAPSSGHFMNYVSLSV